MVEEPLLPPRHRVERRAIGWWALRTVATTAVATGVLLVPYLIFEWSWLVPVLIVVAALGVAHLVVTPWWRYAVHRWEVTEDAVYVCTGWFVREWRIAPISRVQTVDTYRGPLDRLFGLANVTVTTASSAGAVRIVALDSDVADRVVAQLTDIAAIGAEDAT